MCGLIISSSFMELLSFLRQRGRKSEHRPLAQQALRRPEHQRLQGGVQYASWFSSFGNGWSFGIESASYRSFAAERRERFHGGERRLHGGFPKSGIRSIRTAVTAISLLLKQIIVGISFCFIMIRKRSRSGKLGVGLDSAKITSAWWWHPRPERRTTQSRGWRANAGSG